MTKVVKFSLFDGTYRMITPMDIPADLSGEYVSLAEHQRLQALLNHWNELSHNLTIINDSPDFWLLYDKLTQLIQDTSEAVK